MTTLFRRSFGRPLLSALALGTLMQGALGCNLLKKGGGADADPSAAEAAAAPVVEAVDAAPLPATEPLATNEDDVARFPDEKKLENVSATILRVANVREIPNIGKVVASLNKGAPVSQISQRDKFFLVTFDHPKDGKKLMGWVPQEAFTAAPAVDAGIKPLTCAAPEVALISDGPFCGKVCAADSDCPSGQACKGAANKLTNNKQGDAVTVCTVYTPPPAKAAEGRRFLSPKLFLQTDAAAPAAADAAAPAPAAAAGDVTDPVAGKCAAGSTLVAKDNKCHKNCVIGSCKKETTFCVKCAGVSVCSATRDLCK